MGCRSETSPTWRTRFRLRWPPAAGRAGWRSTTSPVAITRLSRRCSRSWVSSSARHRRSSMRTRWSAMPARPARTPHGLVRLLGYEPANLPPGGTCEPGLRAAERAGEKRREQCRVVGGPTTWRSTLRRPRPTSAVSRLGRGGGRARHGGGAERQMATLAQELAERGLRVALIVWPMERPTGLQPEPRPGSSVRRMSVDDSRLGKMREADQRLAGLRGADASVYVYRGGGPLLWVRLGVLPPAPPQAGLLGRERSGLRLRSSRSQRLPAALYSRALPHVDLIVAQRQEQLELARAAGFGPVAMIRSSSLPAEPTEPKGEAFLWISRLVDYKRPLATCAWRRSVPEARFWAVWNVTDETRPGLAGRWTAPSSNSRTSRCSGSCRTSSSSP